MNQAVNAAHLGFDSLVEYWLGETDEATTQGIDMHLMACDACGAKLDEVISLAQGLHQAFTGGLVPSFVTSAFVDRLRERGLRVSEYCVPRNGSVNCSVAPQDELLVGRMAAPLDGVNRIDVALRLSFSDEELRVEDVPFDAIRGELLFAPKLADLRKLPSHNLHIRLLACDEQGSREIGHYTFHHSA